MGKQQRAKRALARQLAYQETNAATIHRREQDVVSVLRESNNIALSKTNARLSAPRHAGDLMKRVFFKNALYEVIAIKDK